MCLCVCVCIYIVEAPRLTSLRTQLRALLNVHLRHSRPTTTLSPPTHDSAPTVPQWQLVCSPETLPELVGDLVGAVLDPKASLERSGVSMGVGVEEALSVCDMDDEWQADVKHEVETWRLLQVRHTHIHMHQHTLPEYRTKHGQRVWRREHAQIGLARNVWMTGWLVDVEHVSLAMWSSFRMSHRCCSRLSPLVSGPSPC